MKIDGATGPLFWGAAAAAALGASLLMAALLLRLRRRGPARRIRRPVLSRLLRSRRAPAAGAARAVPGGYAPAQPALAGLAAAASGPDPVDVELLLARLRRASARLAALEAEAGESHLKATPSRSDQLYRRGVG